MNLNIGGIKKICGNKNDTMLFVIGKNNTLHFIELKEKDWTLSKENEGDGINIR